MSGSNIVRKLRQLLRMGTSMSGFGYYMSKPGTGKAGIFPRFNCDRFRARLTHPGAVDRFCHKCGCTQLWSFEVKPPYRKSYTYFLGPAHCRVCISKAEHAFLDSTSDPDLMLYLGHIWFTEACTETYKKRLHTYLGVEDA